MHPTRQEPHDLDNAVSEDAEVAGQLILDRLMHEEGALWQQADHLRKEAAELAATGGEEANEESARLSGHAGVAESVARQVGDVIREIKADPKKKVEVSKVKALTLAAAQAITGGAQEMGDSEEVEVAENEHRAHVSQHAANAHKAEKKAAAAEPKAKKEKAASKSKHVAADERRAPTHKPAKSREHFWQTASDDYLKPAWKRVKETVSDAKDFVLDSAPVVTAVSIAKTTFHAVTHPMDTFEAATDMASSLWGKATRALGMGEDEEKPVPAKKSAVTHKAPLTSPAMQAAKSTLLSPSIGAGKHVSPQGMFTPLPFASLTHHPDDIWLNN